MKKSDRNALLAFPVLILIGFLVAVAGSQGGSTISGIPVFALCVGLAFLIQWLAFIPAFRLQTEKFFHAWTSQFSQSPDAVKIADDQDNNGHRPAE